jgi:hypothetical protein
MSLADFADEHTLTLIAKDSWPKPRARGKAPSATWYAGFENVSEAYEDRAPLYGSGPTPWAAFADYAQVLSGRTVRITRARRHTELLAPALCYRAHRWDWRIRRIEKRVARWWRALRRRQAPTAPKGEPTTAVE